MERNVAVQTIRYKGVVYKVIECGFENDGVPFIILDPPNTVLEADIKVQMKKENGFNPSHWS